jgi:ribosomal protein S2
MDGFMIKEIKKVLVKKRECINGFKNTSSPKNDFNFRSIDLFDSIKFANLVSEIMSKRKQPEEKEKEEEEEWEEEEEPEEEWEEEEEDDDW